MNRKTKRLTERFYNKEHDDTFWHFKDGDVEHYAEQKLGELEDIEEELGIDLATLIKATYIGIWTKYKGSFYFFDNLLIYTKYKVFVQIVSDDEVETFPFDECGETWALTKEELEK